MPNNVDRKNDDLLRKAIELKDKGNLGQSLAILSTIITITPDLKALCLMGNIYWDMEELPESIICFRKATQHYPNDELASLSLFHTLSDNKQDEEAQAEMERFLSISSSEEYESFRADYYFELGLKTEGYPQRVLLFERAAQANPKHADALMELGKSYKHLGEIEKAEMALKKSIHINDDGMARLWLGNLFYSTGQFDLAEKEYIIAQNYFPENAAPIWAQGDIYRQRGDQKKSGQLYCQAVKLEPNDAHSLARLGRWLLENNKETEGAKYLRLALKEDPGCRAALKWMSQFNIDAEAEGT